MNIFDGGESRSIGEVDAAIIATPHCQHVSQYPGARRWCASGRKPIAAHKTDAERLIAVAGSIPTSSSPACFSSAPSRAIEDSKLIKDGELGDGSHELVNHGLVSHSSLLREQLARDVAWRGRRVLLNQCLHNLDMMAWLLGPRPRARFCQLGRYHNIEVEDDVTAYLEYRNGATGVLITSTGEAPGTKRFEIAGTRGRSCRSNRLTFTTTMLA